MMVGLYRQFDAPLSNELICRWHELLMNGSRDLKIMGRYRTGERKVLPECLSPGDLLGIYLKKY